MVIDSSVLVALITRESEATLFIELIVSDRYRLVSTVSFVETSIVVGSRYGTAGIELMNSLFRENAIALVPFTQAQAEIACQAYFADGKGHHPAKLNFGDCCSYALAKISKQLLLFKGNDFSQTDIESATK